LEVRVCSLGTRIRVHMVLRQSSCDRRHSFAARGHSEGIPPNEPVKVEVILVSFNRKKKDRTPDEDDNMNLRKFQKKKA